MPGNAEARPGLGRLLGLEPGEHRLVLLMGLLVGMLFCSYTIAKVLRDALFLAEFGAFALPWAYVAVAFTTVAFVWIESRIPHRTSARAFAFHQWLAIAFGIAAAIALPIFRRPTIGAFYLWTGSQAMMLMPHFWVLALEVWDTRRGRRIFPVLAGAGLAGGLLGGAVAHWFATAESVGLVWIMVATMVIGLALGRILAPRRQRHRTSPVAHAPTSSWQIVRRSRYIQVLGAVLALSVVVGTLVDFQFKYVIQNFYRDPFLLTQFLGTFYIGLNLLALLLQFGLAGWIMSRLSLGTSNSLQPAAVLVLAIVSVVTNAAWAAVALRWIQGVVSQSFGKSSTELYYGAIRPAERRRIKPAIDTLVERWSDALVGLLLIVALHVFNAPVGLIVIGTAILSGVWIFMLMGLDRQYGQALEGALVSRWIGPEDAPENVRTPLARRALVRSLSSGDAGHIALALKLCEPIRDATVAEAVRACLAHESPTVRVAAIEAMDAMRIADPGGDVEAHLGDDDDGVRRAAIHYLVGRGGASDQRIRDLLADPDPRRVRHAVEAVVERSPRAAVILDGPWIEGRFAAGTPEDLQLAAAALSIRTGTDTERRLRHLLGHADLDVRRAALEAVAHRARPALIDALLPLLFVPELSYVARRAIAANGDAAVPALRGMLDTPRKRDLAAHTLAGIATRRAVAALLPLARASDSVDRDLGLSSLMRARTQAGLPILPRSIAHRLFLRELGEFAAADVPARGLANHVAPELRLLGESYGELASMALDRAYWALGCAYEARPLFGAFERLKSRDPAELSTVLEYLGHMLPRGVFKHVGRLFETPASEEPPDVEEIADWIRRAWTSPDGWMRACAVRASRPIGGLVLHVFDEGGHDDPRVQAELEALGAEPPAFRPRQAFGC